MKTVFKVLAFLFISTCYSQGSFCDGWTDGFKSGYCYGTYGCVAPYAPPCAIPNIGNDSYRGGYNQGFVAGKNQKEGQEVKTTPNGGAYGQLKPLENTDMSGKINDYIRNDQERKRQNNIIKNQSRPLFKESLERGIRAYNEKDYWQCIKEYHNSKNLGFWNSDFELVVGISYGIIWKENKESDSKMTRDYLKYAKKYMKLSRKHNNPNADNYIALLKEAEQLHKKK